MSPLFMSGMSSVVMKGCSTPLCCPPPPPKGVGAVERGDAVHWSGGGVNIWVEEFRNRPEVLSELI